jgi:hypothetical protein
MQARAWLSRFKQAAGDGAADPEAPPLPPTATADGAGAATAATTEAADAAKAAAARGAYDLDDHQLSLAQLAKRYPDSGLDASDPPASKGLSEAAAAALRAKHGANRLTPPKTTPEIVKFLRQLLNPLLLMLLVAGCLTYMAYAIQSPRDRTNLILASALVAVVLLTALMTYWQERSAGNVMASLGKMMPAQCTVVRRAGAAAGGGNPASGGERRIDAAELVPGDVVRLTLGDRVPADVRILHSQDLKVEMSSLTGESDLVAMTVDARHPLPAEARNVAFASSLVMNGGGTGVVVRTGDGTMIGRIASLATQTSGEKSTLEREVHRLVVFVAILASCVAVVLFVIGLAQVRRRRFFFFVSRFCAAVARPHARSQTKTPQPTTPQTRTNNKHNKTASHLPLDRLCQRLHPRHRCQRARGPPRHRHLAAVADGHPPKRAQRAYQAHVHHRVVGVGHHHRVGQDGNLDAKPHDGRERVVGGRAEERGGVSPSAGGARGVARARVGAGAAVAAGAREPGAGEGEPRVGEPLAPACALGGAGGALRGQRPGARAVVVGCVVFGRGRHSAPPLDRAVAHVARPGRRHGDRAHLPPAGRRHV